MKSTQKSTLFSFVIQDGEDEPKLEASFLVSEIQGIGETQLEEYGCDFPSKIWIRGYQHPFPCYEKYDVVKKRLEALVG